MHIYPKPAMSMKTLSTLLGTIIFAASGTAQNVGIGTTTPNGKLTVESNGAFVQPQLWLRQTTSNFVRLRMQNTADPSSFWDVAARTGSDLSADTFNIYHSSQGNLFSITPFGMVGVGYGLSSGPAANLHVHHEGLDVAMLKLTNRNTGKTGADGLSLTIQAIHAGLINFEGGDILLSTQTAAAPAFGSQTLIIKPSGAIGLGTPSPTAKLDVAGQVRIRGGSPANGFVLTSDATGLGTWLPGNQHHHFGQQWEAPGFVYGLSLVNPDASARGLIAQASSSTGIGIGVQARANSNSGFGVLAYIGPDNPDLAMTGAALAGVGTSRPAIYGQSATHHAAWFKTTNAASTQPTVKIEATGRDALEISNGFMKVSGNQKTAFIATATAANISGNYFKLNYANAAPTDMVIVTPIWEGVYVNVPIGVFWEINAWAIFTQNLSPMPVNAKFNVMVIKQ